MKIKTYKLEEEDRYVDLRSYIDGVYFGDPCEEGEDKDYWAEQDEEVCR